MVETKSTERSPDDNRRGSGSSANRYWRSQPNDGRETWAFLAIGASRESITSETIDWKLGTGNATQIVQIYGNNMDSSDAAMSLYERLNKLRQNEATLFTPTIATLQYLRTYLLANPAVESPTLRGFDHVALVETVNEHFAEPEQLPLPRSRLSERPTTGEPEDEVIKACWEVRTRIGHLVPNEDICGDPL